MQFIQVDVENITSAVKAIAVTNINGCMPVWAKLFGSAKRIKPYTVLLSSITSIAYKKVHIYNNKATDRFYSKRIQICFLVCINKLLY